MRMMPAATYALQQPAVVQYAVALASDLGQ